MRVDHVGHPMNHHPRPEHRSSSGEGTKSKHSEPQSVAGADTPVQKGEHEQEHVKGVIRLLEQGHFKGVADVRLRINFFEELSQRAAARTVETLPDEARALVDAVERKVDELISPLEIDPASDAAMAEALAAFNKEVESAVAAQVDSGDLSLDSLSEALQAGFDDLLQRIGEILQPPVESPDEELADKITNDVSDEVSGDATGDGSGIVNVAEDPAEGIPVSQEDGFEVVVVNEPGAMDPPEQPEATDPLTPVSETDTPSSQEDDTSAFSVEDALGELQATFDDALNSLLENLQGSLQLGEPSPPSGNGVAYDKFLAIYHDLLNGNVSQETDEPEVDQTI